MLKSQKNLVPRPLSTHSTSSPSAAAAPMGVSGVGSTVGGSGPRDLTSTLMESNMRNLSLASKANSVSNIPAGGGITAYNGQSGPAAPTNSSMGLSPSINWGSASSTVSLRYDTAQSSLNSSTSSIGSAGRGSVDTSSFDSLFGSGGIGGGGGFGGNKPPMGMMASGGHIGASPMRPTSVMQPQGGSANFMMMGQPRPNIMQNANTIPWGGGAATSVFPPMSSSASSVPASGPHFAPSGGNIFQSNPSSGWGGSGGPVIGPRVLPTPQQGLMQPQRPQQQQQQPPKPLSNDDLNDLLG